MRLFAFSILFLFTSSCNTGGTSAAIQNPNDTIQEKTLFFPVTAYIKGQIHDIIEKGLTPIRYITANNQTDSTMLKFDQLSTQVADFLHPEIDSASLVPFYKESKFLDQTLDVYTFSYEARSNIPDSLTLKNWDVYIDPSTNRVKRVYMVKNISADKQLQLTWQSNKWCKITTIITRPDGNSRIEKEEKILWEY